MTPRITASTFRRWWPVALWCLVILGASSVPGSTLGRVSFHVPDKLVHAMEFSVLGTLALRRQWGEPGVGLGRATWTALLLGVAVGVLDETYQRWIPQRTPSVADWGADSLGTMCGVALARWRISRSARVKTPSTKGQR